MRERIRSLYRFAASLLPAKTLQERDLDMRRRLRSLYQSASSLDCPFTIRVKTQDERNYDLAVSSSSFAEYYITGEDCRNGRHLTRVPYKNIVAVSIIRS